MKNCATNKLPFDTSMLEQTDIPCLLISYVLGCTITQIANVHVNVDMTFYLINRNVMTHQSLLPSLISA